MSLPITPISAPTLIGTIDKVVTGTTDGSFQNILSSAIQHVQDSGSAADAAAQNFLSGGTQELHSTILAGEAANLDFEMLMQVRNKVVSAYEDIMRMQL